MPRRSTRGEEKHTNPETHKSETYPTRAEARGHTPRGHECYCLRSLFPPSPPPPHPTPPHKRKMFVCLNYRAKCLCAPEYRGGEFGPARGRRGPLRGHQKACEKMFVCLNYRAKSLCTNIFKAEFPSQNSETTKRTVYVCVPHKNLQCACGATQAPMPSMVLGNPTKRLRLPMRDASAARIVAGGGAGGRGRRGFPGPRARPRVLDHYSAKNCLCLCVFCL